jgi:tetrahydromethanopterin S-methyltransferase subunit E
MEYIIIAYIFGLIIGATGMYIVAVHKGEERAFKKVCVIHKNYERIMATHNTVAIRSLSPKNCGNNNV